MKRRIKERVWRDEHPDTLLQGTVDAIEARMRETIADWRAAGVTEIETDSGYEGGTQLNFFREREESDKEYERRTKAEEKAAALSRSKAEEQERRERATLAALKAKYER